MAIERTPDGLPVPTGEILEGITEDLMRQKKQFLDEVLKRLERENEVLYATVRDFMSQGSERGLPNFVGLGFGLGVAATYEALRKKSASDKLEEETGYSDS